MKPSFVRFLSGVATVSGGDQHSSGLDATAFTLSESQPRAWPSAAPTASQLGLVAIRTGFLLPALVWAMLSSTPVLGQPAAMQPKPLPTPLSYDIVYVRGPRFGDNQNTTWPEIFHPAKMDAGADLMLLHPNGLEEVLVNCDEANDENPVCSVVDPVLSFDAQWVYYSLFPDMRDEGINSQRDLPWEGADIYRMHLQSRQIQRLTHQEFTPNTGAGIWYKDPVTGLYDPLHNDDDYTRLGYGILNTGPCPLPGGRIMFTSNRNGFAPPKDFTNPTLQLYVMDDDGSNVELVGHLNLGSALHPVVLKDGRVMFSSYESQGIRDIRLWGLWAIWPDGRVFEPLMSSFFSPQAFHFQTQLTDGQIVVVDYYNLNNNGFGTIYKFPSTVPENTPAFGSWRPSLNPPLKQGVFYNGQPNNRRMAFSPYGISVVTPFTTGQDEAAPPYVPGDNDGPYMGKFTHPAGAPNNDLLVVWTPGPANDLDRPTTRPYYDAGLYLIQNGGPAQSPGDLFIVKPNNPNYNEQWPRPVVPYSAIYGVAEPVELSWLPNDGSRSPELPPGTPHGLVGTSSLYKRDSFPGSTTYYGQGPDPYNGLDVFNTSENDQNSNWSFQGSDSGKYSNSEIYAIRILAMEPTSHRSYGAHGGCCGHHRQFSNHATEKLRILGEVPVRKPDVGGQPVLDPDGNPDTSFLVKIPADVPFTFQMLDKDGLALTTAQTWHQVRPGEVRNNCGGCHSHSQLPTSFAHTSAAQPGYVVRDLSHNTPLLSADQNDNPILNENAGVTAADVEYFKDIQPVLLRSCVPCHSKNGTAAAQLVLDDDNVERDGLPGTYMRLANDNEAEFGIKPVISFGPYWRQSNASRYIRAFQSRRSLLIWKIFGRRLDGWTNADHPTEAVPGNPAGLTDAQRNLADIDYTGTAMPPPAAVQGGTVPGLTADEKRNFARWVDLGCPIDLSRETPNWGWFVDDLRPTLTVSSPRGEQLSDPLYNLRIGAFDYYSGLAMSGGRPTTLSVKADFAIDGRPAGTELAPFFSPVSGAADVYQMSLAQPIEVLDRGLLTVRVVDQRGNETIVRRSFSVNGLIGPVAAWRPWAAFSTALVLLLAGAGLATARRSPVRRERRLRTTGHHF